MIPCLRHAEDVEFGVIAPGGMRILAALDHCTRVIGRDLWITAGTNDHTTGRHPKGEAFDVRTKDLPTPALLRAIEVLNATLGGSFSVLYETPTTPNEPALAQIAYVNPHATGVHLHIQVRKGLTYPS